jgi:hypothetical protein
MPRRHATELDEDPSVGNDRFGVENGDPGGFPICFVPQKWWEDCRFTPNGPQDQAETPMNGSQRLTKDTHE